MMMDENKMSSPLVTIFIPTYNQLRYIKRAIDSVLAQSYKNVEIIVGDDSDFDDYRNFIEGYLKFKNFKYIKNIKRLGLVMNYRQGISIARGDFYINLDGDDYFIDNNFIEKSVGLFMKNSSVVAVIGGQEIRSELSDFVSVQLLTKNDFSFISGRDFFLQCISEFSPVIPHLATMVKLDVARSINYYSANLINTDLHSIRRLMLCGDIIIINNICGVWTDNGKNVSRKFNAYEHAKNILSIVEPYDSAKIKYADDSELIENMEKLALGGMKKYVRDAYSICLRSSKPIKNISDFNKYIKEFDKENNIKLNIIHYPDILRNLIIRLTVGEFLYGKLISMRNNFFLKTEK